MENRCRANGQVVLLKEQLAEATADLRFMKSKADDLQAQLTAARSENAQSYERGVAAGTTAGISAATMAMNMAAKANTPS